MENTHCGAFMMVEKEATEKKMNAAVASTMYPAYRTTGMQKRMFASNQQQNADLRKCVDVSRSATLILSGQSM